MAQKLKETDIVMIGVGMTGSIIAKELAAAGYGVVGLERGRPQFTVPDFQGPWVHDELRFDVRKALMQDNTREAMTFETRRTRPRYRFAAGNRSCLEPAWAARWCTGTARRTDSTRPISR